MCLGRAVTLPDHTSSSVILGLLTSLFLLGMNLVIHEILHGKGSFLTVSMLQFIKHTERATAVHANEQWQNARWRATPNAGTAQRFSKKATASQEAWAQLQGRGMRTRGAGAHTHLLAPVHTIFPELNIRAVVRGSLIRIITAANR